MTATDCASLPTYYCDVHHFLLFTLITTARASAHPVWLVLVELSCTQCSAYTLLVYPYFCCLSYPDYVAFQNGYICRVLFDKAYTVFHEVHQMYLCITYIYI